MADKCIGKLTIDISDVEKKINDINTFLGKIGANINLEDKLSKKISAALTSLVNEAKKAGEETAKAMSEVADAKSLEDANKKIKEATALWKEYYNLMTKAQTARNAGRENQASYYETEANNLVKNVQALREKAEATEAVAKAMRSYNAAMKAGEDKAAAQAVKEQANAQKELAKAMQERQKAEDKSFRQNLKDEETILGRLIELYQKKASLDAEATKAVASGNTANANLYLAAESEINAAIEAIAKYYPELDKVAQADERVAEAELKRQAAVNSAKQKSEDLNYKNLTEDINAYANALTNLLNEQAKFNNQVASGKLVEGSEQYEQAEEKLKHLEQTAIEAGQKLDQSGREAAMGMQQVQTAIDNVNVSMGAVNDSQQVSTLTQVETAYKNLTVAIRQYQIAYKANNQEGMSFWQSQIDASMQIVSAIEAGIDSLNVDEQTRQRILFLIEQAKTQQDGLTKGVIGTSGASSELESQVTSIVTRYLSLMAVIRSINSLIQNTVEYVSEYSDKMNEIQMITMKSDAEVAQLAETYRNIASEMNASSLEMADAAIYFTRQGLPSEEIEKRLKNVTMYAKAANVEFKDASEIITAVVNSMGLVAQEAEDGRNAAQRVADVFLNIGDNAATSGQEIGEAMQKAAASAGAFGVSMEWLASYIAAVSETTRQEARTIGTAFNTIIARLHQIKQTGYNSDDETKVNDIAKALSKIDVVLMDQNNNWRDMEDILTDIADKWGDLDGKTKSYIATTMAGVKQQNVFLALMNDMSKGVEGGSRAFELHEKAINSDGVAADKYSVYLDSVTASQERLTIAQEKFYSLLDDSVIKKWNDTLAGVVNLIADGADALGGINLIIPAIIAGISGITVAIHGMNMGLGTTVTLAEMLKKHPIMMGISAAIAAIGLLVPLISMITSGIETAEDRLNRVNSVLNDSRNRITEYTNVQQQLKEMISDVGTETPMTSEQIEKYNGLLEKLSQVSPVAATAVQQLRDGMLDQSEAAKVLGAEIDEVIKKEQKLSAMSLITKYSNWSPNETAQSSFVAASSQWREEWYEGETGNKGFENALRNAYEFYTTYDHSQLAIPDYEKYFPKEVLDEINKLRKGYADNNKQDDWGTIASVIWSSFVGTSDDNLGSALKEQAESIINDVMTTLGATLNDSEFASVRESLAKKIFGDDMELSADEYRNIGANVVAFLSDVLKNGFSIDPENLIQYIGRDLLGGFFDLYFEEQLAQLKERSDFEEYSVAVSDAIEELISYGFSKMDIADLLENVPLEDWDKAVEKMTNKLKDEISKKSNGLLLHDFILGENGSEEINYLDDLDITTLKLINDLIGMGTSISDIQDAFDSSGSIDEFIEKLRAMSVEVDESEEKVLSWKGVLGDVQTTVKELNKLGDYIKTLKNGDSLDISDKLEIASTHPEFIQFFNDAEKLQSVLEGLRSQQRLEAKNKLSDFMWTDEEFFKSTPFYEEGFKNLLEYSGSLEEGSEALNDVAKYVDESAEALVDSSEKMKEATENWLQAQADAAEKASALNYAKATGFESQLGELQRALSEENGVQSAIDIWNSYDSDLQKSIASTYPNLIIALNEANKAMQNGADNADDLRDAQAGLNKELGKSQKYATAKYFKDSYAAIQKLENGTISATDAYEVFNKEINKVSKAYEDILDVENKQANEAAVAASDVSNLASVLGMTAEEILEDFPGAVDMFNELTGSAGELTGVLNALNNAAFIKITGTSDADFSAIEAGLISVQNLADEDVQKLLATGQWTTEVLQLPQTAAIWNPGANGGGHWSYDTVSAGATILKPTGNNPFKGNTSVKKSNTSKKGGGGGGGGGSKSANSGMTEVERMLDIMSQVNAIQESQQNFYQSQQKYNEQTGRIQGVIGYMEEERKVLENQNGTLEDNIRRIEEWMEKKRAEIATMDKTDAKYEEVADDLDKLQKAHQTYTKQLIDNKTAIDALTKAQEEQRKKIRQMEIDLRNTILKAIEDREKKTKDMLNAEIQMENTILDLITKRYEKERDQILNVTDMKIDALQQERDLLQEQLDLRKQQAEEEDKALKLRELEAKYQRIVADPTRAKEAQGIKSEIDALRKEMSWDAAEKEVKSQQDSIDQQITSLEDYKQYIEEYYEDLFEHPQKLIDEMRTIIMGTQEEIVEWLKANDEEYQKASENSRTAMVEGWEQTYNDMKGILTTYWEEVESIIAQGDDYIIEFLKNNSEEYAKAGQLQAEAYVDEWKKQLDDLRKAHEEVKTEFASGYDVIEKDDTSGGGKSGGGGGGGGGGGDDEKTTPPKVSGDLKSIAQIITGKSKITTDEALGLGKGPIDVEQKYKPEGNGVFTNVKTGDQIKFGPNNTTEKMSAAEFLGMKQDDLDKANMLKKLRGFTTGGVADFTGPAWLDGTPSEPERILNPYQTKLFESMVQALEKIDRISIPGMPNYDAVATGGGSNVSVGDIIVNVDNLDTDDDYEELAEKVSEVLMERIGRTAMVGGIRVGSY